jgi:hypothetical protein
MNFGVVIQSQDIQCIFFFPPSPNPETYCRCLPFLSLPARFPSQMRHFSAVALHHPTNLAAASIAPSRACWASSKAVSHLSITPVRPDHRISGINEAPSRDPVHLAPDPFYPQPLFPSI